MRTSNSSFTALMETSAIVTPRLAWMMDQTFLLQTAERVAHGRTAGTKQAAKQILIELLTGQILASNDFSFQLIINGKL